MTYWAYRQGLVKVASNHVLINWCDDADGLHFKKCAVGTDFLKLTISKLLEFLEVEISNVGMDPIFLGKFLGNFLDNFFLDSTRVPEKSRKSQKYLRNISENPQKMKIHKNCRNVLGNEDFGFTQ